MPRAPPRTEPSVQQKDRLENVFFSLLNFCQSGFHSLCLPFTLGPPFRESLSWSLNQRGEGICSSEPSFRRDLVHCHGQPSPLETSEVSRLIPFLHLGTNYVSSLCTRWWNCYLGTKTSTALFYFLACTNASFATARFPVLD